MEKIQVAIKFIPQVKSYIPLAKQYGDSLGVTSEQRLIYAAMPLSPVYTGNETPEQKAKLDATNEIAIMVLVLGKNAAGETIIVEEKQRFLAFAEIEKITSLIPAMEIVK